MCEQLQESEINGFYGRDYTIEQKEHWDSSRQAWGWEGDTW